MRYRILGSIEVERDGGRIDLGPPRQRALLAALLLRRGEVASVDALVDDLWPDDPPQTATHIVRIYVSQLRKALGGGHLETIGSGYRLRVPDDDVDAWRFERSVAEAGALARSGEDGAAVALREALMLWTGRPLGDLANEPFARPAVARLEERRLAGLEDLYACELDAGRSAELVADLQELVTRHPERERLCAALMLALYRSGRQADALAVYRRVRGHLDETQGLEPGESLRRLEAQMLRQDPALDHPGAAPGPGERPPAEGEGGRRGPALAGLVAAAVLAAVVALLALHERSRDAAATQHGAVTLALFGGRPDPNGSVSATQNTMSSACWTACRRVCERASTVAPPTSEVETTRGSSGRSPGWRGVRGSSLSGPRPTSPMSRPPPAGFPMCTSRSSVGLFTTTPSPAT
jgi:DNA-binding SARP family transcriptional activator